MNHDKAWGAGSADDVQRVLAEALALTPTADAEDARPFRQAMRALVMLWDRTRGGPGWAPARLCAMLAEVGPHLCAYLHNALTLAEGARDAEELFELATRRTALQLVLDACPASPATALIDPRDLDELDEYLRRLDAECGPLPVEAAPSGLPAHHWWWAGHS